MRIVILFLLFAFVQCSSQQSHTNIKPVLRAQYLLTFKEFNNKDTKAEETFVLIANKDVAVFKTVNAYFVDSLKAKQASLQELFPYFDTDRQEQILVNKKKIEVTNSVMDTEIGYKEDNNFNWKLLYKTSMINGIKCQQAETHKFGRLWTACFAPEYQIPFGPYKFNGLPGLILEVKDSENEFIFTLKELKNYKKDYPLNRFSKVKYLTKKEYGVVRKNLSSNFTLAGRIKLPAEEIKKMQKAAEEKLKNLNPIEIKEQ